MFIVRRSEFRLGSGFYVLSFLLILAITGGPAYLAALLTMHVHLGRKKALAPLRHQPKLNLAHIPECDLPALPDRAGPHTYKGCPYYSYPDGTVDGFTQRGWWRLSFEDFRAHIDRVVPD